MVPEERNEDLTELRMFRLFEHFSDPQLIGLLEASRHEQVDEGRTLYSEGDAGDDFFVVVSGGLDAVRGTMVGKQLVARLRMGQIVGEESFIDGRSRATALVATQPSLLLRLDAGLVRQLPSRLKGLHVALLRSFWQSLAAKVRQANSCLAEVTAQVGSEAPVKGNRDRGEAVALQPSTKVGLFAEQGLTSAELRLLATTLSAEKFAPEALIFFEGDLGDCLYIVAEGEVRISRRLPGIGEDTLAVLGRGEVFGEMALIDDLPRSADARAQASGCTLIRLSREDLSELLSLETAAPSFLSLLCRILSKRFRSIVELLVHKRVMAGYA